jgi:hypothetical protein
VTSEKKAGPLGEIVRTSSKTRRDLRKLMDLLSSADYLSTDEYGIAAAMESERAAWTILLPQVHEVLENAARGSAANDELTATRYGGQLRKALEIEGLEVLGDDLMPVVNGIVHVIVDRQRGQISVNDVAVPDSRISAVVDTVKREARELLSRVSPSATFLGELRKAYQDELAISAKPDATPVEALSLVPRILVQRQSAAFLKDPRARSFREYPVTQFRADLSKLIESGEKTIDGREFRYAAGANTAGAVFLFDRTLGRTFHLGRVWFE